MGSLFSTLSLSRLQFALTTIFHMLWPTLTVGLSLFLVIFEVMWIVTKDDIYYRHARFWTKLFILNFAVGVATGLVMEFQFGTNWDRFSVATGGFFGDVLGFEGTLAFMLEAGFLGVMVFGWGKVPRAVHLVATILVAFGATLSTFWILVANSWMQTPAGGYFLNGSFVLTDYIKALFNPDAPLATTHMWIACIETSAFVLGGISAWFLLRRRNTDFFARSFKLAVIVAIIATPAQVFIGDLQGLLVYEHQPEKIAALESHWDTNKPGTGAPWNVVAWPDVANERNSFAVQIPYALSLLEKRSLTGEVKGLKEFAPENRPPILIPFYSFRIMVAIGFFLVFVMVGTVWIWIRKGLGPDEVGNHPRMLKFWLFSLPLGYIAVETGWLTREVGRQPWIIFHLLRTEDAFSLLPAGAVAASLSVIIVVYAVLLVVFFKSAKKILKQGPDMDSPVPVQGGAL